MRQLDTAQGRICADSSRNAKERKGAFGLSLVILWIELALPAFFHSPDGHLLPVGLRCSPLHESNPMKYFIAASTAAFFPMPDLARALRAAYDGGAHGYFRILPAAGDHFTVIFERDSDADAEYVSKRAQQTGASIEASANQQLAAELQAGGAGDCAADLIEELRANRATVFDFECGAIESMAVFEPAAPESLPSTTAVL